MYSKFFILLKKWGYLFIWSLFIIFFNFYIGSFARVYGNSMYPTLYDKDILFVQKFMHNASSGDIVIIKSQDEWMVDKDTLVKRIIAEGGETVTIDSTNNVVYVNGEPIEEPYIVNDNYIANSVDDASGSKTSYTVPENYVFVLGDNRNNSTDSRILGCISEDYIIGKAILRIPIGEIFS